MTASALERHLARNGWSPERLADLGWAGPVDALGVTPSQGGVTFLDWACGKSRALVDCLLKGGVSPNTLVVSWPGFQHLGADMFGCIEDLVRAGLDVGQTSVFSNLVPSVAQALCLHHLPGHPNPAVLFDAFDHFLDVMVEHGWEIEGVPGYNFLHFLSGKGWAGYGTLMEIALARNAWTGGDENDDYPACGLLEYCKTNGQTHPCLPARFSMLEKAVLGACLDSTTLTLPRPRL